MTKRISNPAPPVKEKPPYHSAKQIDVAALTAERDALAAHVDMLRESITAAVYGSKLDSCGNRDEDGLLRYGNPNNICRQLIDALQASNCIKKGGEK